MNKKVLFVVTEDWYFLSHRLKLALYLMNKGFHVGVCCKDTGNVSDIKNKGIDHYNLNINRKSLSLIRFISEFFLLIKIIKKAKPNIVHLISMRPIIIGIFSSLFVKSGYCATFTGMGFLFIKEGIKGFILRNFFINFLNVFLILKKIIIVVQKKDDEIFLKKFKLRGDFLKVIKGSGIDLDFHKYCPEVSRRNINLAYAGRILYDKGLVWLVNSFKLARKENPNLVLYIAGALDEKNPTSIKKSYFEKIINIDGIHYLGNIKNIKKFWRNANIAILLSKREGLPLSLLEAAATGRAIISTDVPGSREIAISGFNSINVKIGNILECSNAILKLANNKSLREKYGKNSRKLVEGDMSLEHVCNQYFCLYKELM